eukprot:scaffold50583_cov20-Tisochrysis_lutea.AAC.1
MCDACPIGCREREKAADGRRDKGLKFVTISEKWDKKAMGAYTTPSVPFPFDSKETYERSIRQRVTGIVYDVNVNVGTWHVPADAYSRQKCLLTTHLTVRTRALLAHGAWNESELSNCDICWEHAPTLWRHVYLACAPPLGRQYNPDSAFRDLTRPAILKNTGVIIDPVRYSKPLAKHTSELDQTGRWHESAQAICVLCLRWCVSDADSVGTSSW